MVLDEENRRKLEQLKNPKVIEIVEKYARLCKAAKVKVLIGTPEDEEYVRNLAIKNGEEAKLSMEGHTFHMDGFSDQGRDLENTRVMLPPGRKLSEAIKTIDLEQGTKEIHGILDGIMQGKEMLVSFYCLGPNDSPFSIAALQLTDSAYVTHSENILYRKGYDEFKRLNGKPDFFYFIHSAGKLDERGNSVDVAKRRIYMDIENECVYTVNNQYAGNSVGLKKLALRLAIAKANREDWLCEHMFIMGVHPKAKKRVTYFTGAFPTACGKTSTAMIPGQTIVGDDIAYIRPGKDGKAYAVNVEAGIFGIIKDINPEDDPIIYETLATPREQIVSNVLIYRGEPFWLGMGKTLPKEGLNFSGEWIEGKRDAKGNLIPAAHENARYTIKISDLKNADPKSDDPEGVPIGGIFYGGRDSDTSVPISQSLSWPHGIFNGAIIESETVAGTSDKPGVLKHNPMSNIEFLTVPLGLYISNHLKFGEALDQPLPVFTTNYFLKKDGKWLNSKLDKKVWVLWAEGRVHNEFGAIETPVGFIPKYEDLKELFKTEMGKDYSKEDYIEQFSIRTSKYIAKMERIEAAMKKEENIPQFFHQHLVEQRERLRQAAIKYQKEVISPFEFAD